MNKTRAILMMLGIVIGFSGSCGISASAGVVSLEASAGISEKPVSEVSDWWVNGAMGKIKTQDELMYEESEDSSDQQSHSAERAAEVTFDHQYENGMEYAVIRGQAADGQNLWSLTTGSYEAVQLARVCEVGIWGDFYCYSENGTVIAVNLTDGTEVWRNTDFGGASASSCMSTELLFICGYFGPDVMVLDQNGRTVQRIDSLNSDYYWPYELSFADGKLAITYEYTPSGQPETLYLDINDWSCTGGQGSSSAASSDPMEAVIMVSATSFLIEYEYNFRHDPENICDGILNTAWIEGVDGNGEGESVTFIFNKEQTLSGFRICNGFQKDESLYYKNGRPAVLKLTFSDDSTALYEISDSMSQQTIAFDREVTTDYVTVAILSVYQGSAYQDTAISELNFY
ncbi:MAG: discoidin domain-containing protein [Eubacteriales bacterium]|nr:discoidin domain-containing protein [Eubacteriales bacterium]